VSLNVHPFALNIRSHTTHTHTHTQLSFRTASHRNALFRRLETGGYTREVAHATVDLGLLAMRQAVIAPSRLRVAPPLPVEPQPDQPFPSHDQRQEFHKILIRGSSCYQKFDEALGSARKRIPQGMFDGWVVRGGGAVSPEASCAICMGGIDADDEMVALPCPGRHSFHRECIVSWAHASGSCPTCRFPLQTVEP
jgi:hypothetical protein